MKTTDFKVVYKRRAIRDQERGGFYSVDMLSIKTYDRLLIDLFYSAFNSYQERFPNSCPNIHELQKQFVRFCLTQSLPMEEIPKNKIPKKKK
jgi:hypothetical protein